MNRAAFRRNFLPESSAEHLTSSNSLERIADVFDLGRVVIFRPDDGHDVEPASLLEQAVFFQEMEGCKGQPTLFFRGDGFSGHSLSAGLDLNEDDDVAVQCNQIDLAVIGPVAAVQDPQTLASEVDERPLARPGHRADGSRTLERSDFSRGDPRKSAVLPSQFKATRLASASRSLGIVPRLVLEPATIPVQARPGLSSQGPTPR